MKTSLITIIVLLLGACTTTTAPSGTGYIGSDNGVSIAPCTPPRNTQPLIAWAKELGGSYETRSANVQVNNGLQQCTASQSAGSEQRVVERQQPVTPPARKR